MTAVDYFEPEFVELIPRELDRARLYVSIPYGTAVHLCACGCGNKVLTPITPTDWRLIYDGETVSLTPSIGNWSYECKSHYWIRENRVLWSRHWSLKEIEKGRAQDRRVKRSYFDNAEPWEEGDMHGAPSRTRGGWIRRLWERRSQ